MQQTIQNKQVNGKQDHLVFIISLFHTKIALFKTAVWVFTTVSCKGNVADFHFCNLNVKLWTPPKMLQNSYKQFHDQIKIICSELKQTSTILKNSRKNNLQSEKKNQIQSWNMPFPQIQADTKHVFYQKNFFAAASCWLLQEKKHKNHQRGTLDGIWIISNKPKISYLYMM